MITSGHCHSQCEVGFPALQMSRWCGRDRPIREDKLLDENFTSFTWAVSLFGIRDTSLVPTATASFPTTKPLATIVSAQRLICMNEIKLKLLLIFLKKMGEKWNVQVRNRWLRCKQRLGLKWQYCHHHPCPGRGKRESWNCWATTSARLFADVVSLWSIKINLKNPTLFNWKKKRIKSNLLKNDEEILLCKPDYGSHPVVPGWLILRC
jgi:hypothetical protein